MDFLQRAPECVAPTDKSMYLDRVLKETCPKLLKSGLLTSTEQQWWESFSSVVITYLKTSRNVSIIRFSFFTIHLLQIIMYKCNTQYQNLNILIFKVDFPLIHLIESVKEIPETLMSHPVETRLQELEDKAMKRALVMQILLFVYVTLFKIICKTSVSILFSFKIIHNIQFLQYFEVSFILIYFDS